MQSSHAKQGKIFKVQPLRFIFPLQQGAGGKAACAHTACVWQLCSGSQWTQGEESEHGEPLSLQIRHLVIPCHHHLDISFLIDVLVTNKSQHQWSLLMVISGCCWQQPAF